MTVIYSKKTGAIKCIVSGSDQSIDTIFGAEAEDYKLIWDEIMAEDDIDVIMNHSQFKVNIDTKQLEMISITNKYPIATS